MAQKKGIRRRKCARCARGEEVFGNEVTGIRAYESYWHFTKNKRFVECVDGLLHEVRRLRSDRDWLVKKLGELMKEKNDARTAEETRS
jgi:hypothetical protein